MRRQRPGTPSNIDAIPIPVVGFVGSSGSGKTTLIERLLPLLRAEGYRVGVLKHAHKGFQMDRPGKDSHRVREAGAVQVLVASSRQWALIGEETDDQTEPGLHRLLRRFSPGEVELVLAEGFSHESFPKIEVFRPSHGQPPLCWPHDPDVIAVASDAALQPNPPIVALDLNRPDAVAEFVLSRVLPRGAGGPKAVAAGSPQSEGMDQMAKFGVLGSGEVGQELAKGLRGIGHEVRIGSRDPKKLAAYTAETKIPNGTFAEVATWADALVLSVKGSGAEAALRQAGLENLSGKLIIDTTNPITDDPPQDGVLKFFTGPNESLMERLQKAAPRARFVKAFSSVGSATMVNPKFAGAKPTMFYCGDDPAARAETARILEQFGWEGADMGTAVAARAIEPLAVLWCIRGFREDRWTHALKLLTR